MYTCLFLVLIRTVIVHLRVETRNKREEAVPLVNLPLMTVLGTPFMCPSSPLYRVIRGIYWLLVRLHRQ